MKKKLLAVLLVTTMAFSLMACSSTETVESEKEVVEDSTTEDEATEEDDSTTGEVVEENGVKKVPVITDKELNKTGESGPFKYAIKAIQVSKLTATTDEMAELLEIEKDTEVTLVVMDVSVENTTDATNYIYFDQATLTTNTKEQVESNMWLSDYIDGEYLGAVIHEGSIYYVLKNTNADDLTNITLHVDAPYDENFDTIGDNITIDLTFE